jgi:hypothetical protein
MEIKKESHPYYAQWRVMSEWCTENAVGVRGQITLQSAIDLRKTNKAEAATAQEKVGEADAATLTLLNGEQLHGSSSITAAR